jgi:hypothetical protein
MKTSFWKWLALPSLLGCGILIGMLINKPEPPVIPPAAPPVVIYQQAEPIAPRPYSREWREEQDQKLQRNIERVHAEQARDDVRSATIQTEADRQRLIREMEEANNIARQRRWDELLRR